MIAPASALEERMMEPILTAQPGPSEAFETFGRYTILRSLGRGGVGAVFLARKSGASEICVLKKLLTEHQENKNLIRRFRREANLCSHLEHPNIARILDAGTEDGTFFIAFEYVAGQPLSALCSRLYTNADWLPWEHSVAVILDVLEGLIHAHERTDPEGRPLNLVHRDLSPNNILVGYDGKAKIIDFGLAAGRVDDLRTQPGELLGTYRYMSPEQALLKPLDQRSDLYTIAVVLHEILAKERMVPKGTVREILAHIAVRPAPLLRDVAANVPEGLTAVLQRALEKDPDARWQTARDLRDALLGVPGLRRAEPSEMSDLIQRHFLADKHETDGVLRLGGKLARGDEISPAQAEQTAFVAPSIFKEWPAPAPMPPPAEVEISAYFPPARRSVPLRTERLLLVGVVLLLNLLAIVVIVALWFPRKVEEHEQESLPIAVPRPKPPHAVGLAKAEAPALRSGSAESEPAPQPALAPSPEPSAPRRLEPSKSARHSPAQPRPNERAQRKPAEAEVRSASVPHGTVAFARCRQLLAELHASPSDGALLVKLYRELKKEADRLPPERRKAIYLEIDAGLRGGDVESMERGLARLVEAAAAAP